MLLVFNCMSSLNRFFVCSLWFMLDFGDHFMLDRFSMLYCFLLSCFMLYFWFNFLLNIYLLFMFRFRLSFVLYFMLRLILNLMFNFVLFCFMLKISLLFWLLYFLSLVSSFFFFWLFIMFDISLGCLFEWFGDISNCSPIFSMFFLLSSHFDEKSSCKNLLVKAGSDEVNGINFTFKDNFKRPRVILFDFDKIELGECFLNIFFNCLEVTFDQVKRNLLNLVTQSFDLIYYLIFARHNKLLLLLSTSLHHQ